MNYNLIAFALSILIHSLTKYFSALHQKVLGVKVQKKKKTV